MMVMTAYLLELLQLIGFLVAFIVPGNDFVYSHPFFPPITTIVLRLFFCFATTILASILYKLGEQQAAATNLQVSFE